jgi:hypothetical protein
MNLKTADRVSSILVTLTLVLVPLAVWQPILIAAAVGSSVTFAFLNRESFRFYTIKRGLLFATMTVPWHALYFFYSGCTFALCCLEHFLTKAFGQQNPETKISS